MPNNQNMHRNVFFKDCAKVPAAAVQRDRFDKPEDLWTWMDGQRRAGNEVLAISHNANSQQRPDVSDRRRRQGPPDRCRLGRSRAIRNEPLTEIKQVKGASETHPCCRRPTSSPISRS